MRSKWHVSWFFSSNYSKASFTDEEELSHIVFSCVRSFLCQKRNNFNPKKKKEKGNSKGGTYPLVSVGMWVTLVSSSQGPWCLGSCCFIKDTSFRACGPPTACWHSSKSLFFDSNKNNNVMSSLSLSLSLSHSELGVLERKKKAWIYPNIERCFPHHFLRRLSLAGSCMPCMGREMDSIRWVHSREGRRGQGFGI